MQAGVTCTSFFLTTQRNIGDGEKKNHDLAPELVAYTLSRSISHASHQCGHDFLSPIAVYTVMGGL